MALPPPPLRRRCFRLLLLPEYPRPSGDQVGNERNLVYGVDDRVGVDSNNWVNHEIHDRYIHDVKDHGLVGPVQIERPWFVGRHPVGQWKI